MLGLALLAHGVWGASGAVASVTPADLVGKPAPRFILRTLNPDTAGPRFVLRDHVGPKARFPKRKLLLDFAASWCAPCRDDLERLARLAGPLAKADVAVAVVVIDDTPEGIATMSDMVNEDLQLPFPAVADRYQVLARRYAVENLPLAIVIDADGIVRHVEAGITNPGFARIRAALGLPAGRSP